MLLIRCNYCQLVNEIPTGSRHKTIAGGIAWDVNTKLAAGKDNLKTWNETLF